MNEEAIFDDDREVECVARFVRGVPQDQWRVKHLTAMSHSFMSEKLLGALARTLKEGGIVDFYDDGENHLATFDLSDEEEDM